MSQHDPYWLHRISPCPHILGYMLVRPYWRDAPRVCYDHYLTFVDKGGSMRIELDDEVHEIPEFHYIILPPGLRHRRETAAPHAFRRFWLHFDWALCDTPWIKPILTSGAVDPDKIHHAPDYVPPGVFKGSIPNPTEFIAKFERANDLFHARRGFQALATRGIVLELLLDLLASPAEEDTDVDLGIALEIRRALDRFAGQRVDRTGSIIDFLAARGQSYDHQARVFKRVFGATPLQYVTSLRLERAKNLLCRTSTRITEIAQKLGFTDVGYFSKLFHKHVGQSPGQFRKSQLDES